ncbi:MAG: DNA polymerase III subunit alpha [Candidatus Levyibacteriota bacterium]
MADFVHLHNHSEYSLLDGLSKIPDMVAKVKALGMNAVAITDHGNMYGTIKFYKECKAQGIKPIIGCEIYVAKRSLTDKEAGIDNDYNHLILLAENNVGYKNLMKIVSVANLDGYYYKPRTDLALLEQYSEGLICLTACVNGFVGEPLLAGQQEEAEKRLKNLLRIFGEGNVFLELQKHLHVPPQEPLNEKLIALSKKFAVPLVATNDNHYINKNDAEAQEILLAIQTQTTILDEDRKLTMIDSPDFYLKTPDEMMGLFIKNPEAVENTVKIAERCNVDISLGKWILPKFKTPDDSTTAEYLNKLVEEGLVRRYKEVTDEIRKRVEYELSVIVKKGYETYFLTVADFVNWAKSQGISVGPGRGSAAGSVISYVLNITDIDPFYFNLPFERFLNPDRPSAPDIDLDFADTRRDEVIAYVTQKYGEDKVAQIITFGTMEARGAVRDAGRALGMPYAGPDRIAKMIPPGWQGHAMTIEKALEQSPDLKRAYLTEQDTKRLLDVAQKLEGVARHASVHAAGVVIADKPLTDYTPLQRETNGDKIVTQYDMYTVGEDGVGLLKMDFLGLRNLTIIEEALRFIKEVKGVEIDLTHVPLDDKPTYELLSNAETTGIFQLESAGMRRYIKELRPTSIFDLMAMVALYRPGPMQNIPDFISRKHNPKLISYPDPRLVDILKNSYGILTFQDDVLLTTIALAGYTWLDADKFRKAMGKKIPSEMKKQQEIFIMGAIKNGLTQRKAEEIFELIAPFAGYGFNKAHAACYATIAFRTAYLKAHYPVEFMTALLTAESRGTTGPQKNEKIAQAVAECKRLHVEILAPSVNYSESDFSIEANMVRFGLSAIKNVGSSAISSILEARSQGRFTSLQDFLSRVDLTKVNKKTVESLIKAGAMDEFGKRSALLTTYPELAEKASRDQKNATRNQASLFGDMEEELDMSSTNLPDVEEFSEREKLMFEKELLGFFLTNHPLSQELDNLARFISHTLTELEEEKEGISLKIGGLVSSVKKIITKKSNQEMAFVTIEDHTGVSIECVVFPKTFEVTKQVLLRDSVVIVEGKLQFKDERPVIIVDGIKRLTN